MFMDIRLGFVVLHSKFYYAHEKNEYVLRIDVGIKKMFERTTTIMQAKM